MKKRLNKIQHGMPTAFTLVELLVVIAIIALLLGILMPSLNKARQSAYAIKCAANLHNVGAAMLSYTIDSSDSYPCSYIYASDNQGNYNLNNQTDKSYGYIHWSYFLSNNGRCDKAAFMCPSFKHGGAPRTNPGSNTGDWEGGQIDGSGQTTPNSLTDKQGQRMAYTANGAIIPRNKFTIADVAADSGSSTGRVNQFVKAGSVRTPSGVILATEFTNDWQAIAVGNVSKSHRPIEAFSDLSAGYAGMALYSSPPSRANCYIYGDNSDPTNKTTRGVKKLADITGQNALGLIDGSQGSPINAVGRQHPGGGYTKDYGGCANFLYCDGHVERKTILQTMQNFEWGKQFYSMTGGNNIDLTR